ncbi:hypothetical protein C8Q75DRAFT_804525 [Abortiporus biennis]|nr:hypothetical protein C8Q75DRAFT_804525 [Abortiporus biennis]
MESFSGLSNFYSWRDLSRVCYRWWQVVKNSPCLSGFIVYDGRSSDFRKTVQRVENNAAPVFIRFAESRITTSEMRRVIEMFDFMDRTHLLRLEVPRRVYHLLESLGIHVEEWSHLHTISFTEDSPTLDSDQSIHFFEEARMPKLRKVVGRECTTGPIHSILRPSVTHLCLENLLKMTSLSDLTEVLASLPNLEVLNLSNVVGSLPWDNFDNRWPRKDKSIKVASLDHLTHLQISSPSTECANIIDYIVFPQDTVLELELNEEKDVEEEYPWRIEGMSLRHIVKRLEDIKVFPLRQPCLTFAAHSYVESLSPNHAQLWFKIQWWSTRKPSCSLPNGSLAGFNGSISTCATFPIILSQACQSLYLEDVEVLYIGNLGHCDPRKAVELWVACLTPPLNPPEPRQASLQELIFDSTEADVAAMLLSKLLTGVYDYKVDGNKGNKNDGKQLIGGERKRMAVEELRAEPPAEFIYVPKRDPVKDKEDCENAAKEPVFPSLKTLVFRHLEVDSIDSILGKKLLDALKFRHKHNMPIQKLSIESEFPISDASLKEFREVVHEVEYKYIRAKLELIPHWLSQMMELRKRYDGVHGAKKPLDEEEDNKDDDHDTVSSLWSTDDDELMDEDDIGHPLLAPWGIMPE